jgi:DNA-binding PadR family transcriptional regulator
LEERDVKDWAAMSKPQVYYSLKKLSRLGFVKPKRAIGQKLGPEKEVLTISAAGRSALVKGLCSKHWSSQRPPPPFLTWLALSSHLGVPERTRILSDRRLFLTQELHRERKTIESFENDSSVMSMPGRLMVDFTIRQFELELVWLDEVEQTLVK